MVNIKYNTKKPEDFGARLASKPVLTPSDIRQTVQDIVGHGDLYELDMYRGTAQWNILIHMKSSEWLKDIRKVRQWLSGTGVLEFSETSDSYYEVLQVAITEQPRKSEDYGRLNSIFYVYPYEFLKSGNTAIIIAGVGAIEDDVENKADMSKPLYHISGTGSGVLGVNGNSMSFTVNEELFIDTRRFYTYDENSAPADDKVSGDYEGLYLPTGDNEITITEGFDLEMYPRWGYVI